MIQTSCIHVAVGVIVNPQGQILIARRPPHVHLGGLWEFPGGKLEADENVEQALTRELAEEVGVQVLSYRPLIKLQHNYPERQVLLDVWRVDSFVGTAHGRENQPIAWVQPDELIQYVFPKGNRPIISAVRLPACYAILDVHAQDTETDLLARLERLAANGIVMAQLRAKAWDEAAYNRLAQTLLRRAEALNLQLLLNAAPQQVLALGAAGVHLSSARLMALKQRPLPASSWVGASCHTLAELAQAQRIAADFAVLGPVQLTASHPDAQPLGWSLFSQWVAAACLPVYALGGLIRDDLATAQQYGAQGIAAIRGFLETLPR